VQNARREGASIRGSVAELRRLGLTETDIREIRPHVCSKDRVNAGTTLNRRAGTGIRRGDEHRT